MKSYVLLSLYIKVYKLPQNPGMHLAQVKASKDFELHDQTFTKARPHNSPVLPTSQQNHTLVGNWEGWILDITLKY